MKKQIIKLALVVLVLGVASQSRAAFIGDFTSSGVAFGGVSELSLGSGSIVQNGGALLAAGFIGSSTSPSGYNSETPVPEASTILAGALMALPLGVSALRIIRNRKVA